MFLKFYFKKQNRLFTQPKENAFSLVELLVAIAIMGILSATVLVSLGGARAKARLGRIQSQLSSLHPQLIMCINDEKALTGGVALIPVGGTTLICGSNTVAFPELPSNWIYGTTVITSGAEAYSASTTEGDAWVVVCTETGCTTTP